MPKQAIATEIPQKRIRNFSEVILGISKKQAVDNARIYVERKGKYEHGCPLNTDVFGFMDQLAKGNLKESLEIIFKENILPGVTGRMSRDPYPQIQVHNRDGQKVSVRALERFISDHALSKVQGSKPSNSNGIKVAIIGSGPAGLQGASTLNQLGYNVTVFESLHQFGGALACAYPKFRIPHQIIENTVSYLKESGVVFKSNQAFGGAITFDIFESQGFQAVLLTTGASVSKKLGIAGEDAIGIFGSDEFLINLNLMHGNDYPNHQTKLTLGENVVVIGGGNAALDCARSCIRLGSNATLVLKETEEDMNVRFFLVDHAREEGVKFEPLTRVIEVLKDEYGCVKGLKACRYDYAESSEGGWDLIEVPDSEFEILADTVIVAIGHEPSPLNARLFSSLNFLENGCVDADEKTGATNLDGVYAAGNIVSGSGPVIDAMVSAKNAANSIDAYLKEKLSEKDI